MESICKHNKKFDEWNWGYLLASKNAGKLNFPGYLALFFKCLFTFPCNELTCSIVINVFYLLYDQLPLR